MEFQVVFESLQESSPEERELIKKKLIEKFKVPAEKAERMIKSAPIVVKKGLTEDQANKYRSALESIGARASIKSIADQQTEQEIKQVAEPAAAPTVIEPVAPPEPIRTDVATKPVPEGLTPAQPEQDFLVLQHDFDKRSQSVPPAPAPPMDPFKDPFKTQVSPSTTDPFKTQVSRSTAEQKTDTPSGQLHPSPTDETEMPTQTQPAMTADNADVAGQWWEKAYVLNPPFDESVPSITPITSGRVSTQPNGFSVSHPMIEKIRFDEILLLSVFQLGLNTTARLLIDIFISTLRRPVRLQADLIDYNTFSFPGSQDPGEQLASFIKYLLEQNRNIVIDLATYRYLKERERLKIVRTDRDIEKYCGKLQSEVEKGLSPESNENVITWRAANEILGEEDPWALPPVPAFPPPVPQPGAMDSPFPPNVYATQPMRPPATATPITPPPPQPQPYQPPQQGYSPGYAPPPPKYGPPAGTPQAPPFGMPAPQQPPPVRPPDIYQGPGQYAGPMPGQFPAPPLPGQMQAPMPGQMQGFGYVNPAMEFEINKARDNAQTALILSIIGVLPCGCLFPLSILGLIKAQDALQIMDTYGIQDERSKAVAAKIIAIAGLILNALIIMSRFLR
jgi:hypothetical protein